jgi:hypothetical protein
LAAKVLRENFREFKKHHQSLLLPPPPESPPPPPSKLELESELESELDHELELSLLLQDESEEDVQLLPVEDFNKSFRIAKATNSIMINKNAPTNGIKNKMILITVITFLAVGLSLSPLASNKVMSKNNPANT